MRPIRSAMLKSLLDKLVSVIPTRVFDPPVRLRDPAILILIFLWSLYLFNSVWRHWDGVPTYVPDQDGRQQLSFLEPIHDAVWNYGEFPLWNPYFGGGVQWAGYIYEPGLSLVSIPHILLGALHGVKVWLLVVLFLGGVGMYYAARWWLELDRFFAAFAAAAYMASQWLPSRALSGNYDETTLMTAPLALVFYYALLNRRWLGLLLPVYFSTLFAQTKYGPFIIAVITGIFGLWWGRGSWKRTGYAVGMLGLAFGVGVLLSLPKLLPLLELMKRDLVDQTQYGGTKCFDSWGDLMLHAIGTPKDGHRAFSQVMGFGVLVFVLACMSFPLSFRKGIPWTASMVLSAFYTLGDRAPVDVTYYTNQLPLFESMSSVAKYWNLPILMSVAALGGLGLQEIMRRLDGPVEEKHRPLVRLLVFAGAFWLVLAEPADWTKSVFGDLFEGKQMDLTVEPEIYHVSVTNLALTNIENISRYRLLSEIDQIPQADQLYNIHRRVGTITWYGNFVYPEHTVPKEFIENGQVKDNPDYRGEVHTLDDKGPQPTGYHVTYNTARFQVPEVVDGPVVVNQNYAEGWQSTAGEVFDADGLIGVRLPGEFTGEVVLYYRNTAFTIGLWVAVVALLGWIGGGWWWIWRSGNGGLRPGDGFWAEGR